jgi:hypothetical protein
MHLDWNMGGWFGSQLGGTVWILIAGAISLGQDLSTGLILILFFLIPNIVGLVLWYRRNLSCYVSTQIIFAFSGFFGLLAIYVLDRNNLWLEIQKGGAISKDAGYFLLSAVILVVMVSFHIKFGRKPNEPST